MGIAATFGELGPAGFLSYVLLRLLAPIPGVSWHRYRLIAVPASGLPAMPRGYVAREMTAAEIRANAAILDLPETAIRHRLSQGMTCLGVWRDERLLGVNWLVAEAFNEDEAPLRFAPPPGCAWDTGLYIMPRDRGGRAFSALWAATASWLRSRGLRWSMSRIADHNVASWRSHTRMGGVSLGSVAVLMFGAHGIAWWRGPARTPVTVTLPEPS